MSSRVLNVKNFLCDNKPYIASTSNINKNSFAFFKMLPMDLQYKIFEMIGGIGTQVSMLGKVPDLQNAVIKRKIMKAYKFFLHEPEGSPAKIAVHEALKKISPDGNILFVSFEKITNLAFKKLFNMIGISEKTKLEDEFGSYSLSLEKIEKAQQILLDKSLLEMWKVVKFPLYRLNINEVPSNNNVETIRKWIRENQVSLQPINELRLYTLEVIIPPELSFFTGVTSLMICNTKIRDLSLIGTHASIQNLTLQNNQISNFPPIVNFPNLQILNLSWNQISDLTSLAALSNLQVINLSWNQISDITPLANLTNLQGLELNHNQISDLAPLANLTNLQVLSLSWNQIIDITPLANLTNLQELELENNQISDIAPLANFTDLQILELINNQVSNISSLEKLTNLKRLELGFNKIRNITPLTNLINLQKLGLEHNHISDITIIKNLFNIELLTINNNKIKDLTSVRILNNLKILFFKNN